MRFTISLLLVIFTLHVTAQLTNHDAVRFDPSRTKTSINADWKFFIGNPDGTFYEPQLDDSSWETVHVPHTLQLTSMDLNGYQDDKYQKSFMRNVGWYRKSIKLSGKTHRKVFLEFEGVHQVTDLWVNGHHVGQHAVGGYTPFHFDITEYVRSGRLNQITIRADNRRRDDVPPDPGPMDFIKFGGLYRDVYVVETNPLHITFNWESESSGISITTPTVDPVNLNGTINIKTSVRNESGSPKETSVINRIVDHRGVVVLKLEQARSIAAGQELVFNQIGSIEDDLHLWSIDDPYLYRVNTVILDGDQAVDELECNTGFRKLEINHHDGLLLNGEPLKLIGVNRHQHYGFIGDAMPNSLHFKDVLQLKRLGMNVLRTAHYPHDNAILEACDALGMLVYEEAPTWMSIGNKSWFDNLEQAARVMVRNHRNHPSVFIWGAGINHRGYVPRIHNAIKQEDPFRWTASQSSRWTGWQTSGLTDIYAQMVYGPYYWSEQEVMLAMEGRRGPEAVNEYMSNSKMLGLISWTAHAYYSFHNTPNPKNRSRSGLTTVFRYPKPGTYWYPAELANEPFIHIESPWVEDIKQLVVYSNAEEVSLEVNGRHYTTIAPSPDLKYQHLKHPPFLFEIPQYEKGQIKAYGLKAGQVMATDSANSPGRPYQVALVLDTLGRTLVADGSDILVGYAEIRDKNGTLLPDAQVDVQFSVKGPGTVVGHQTPIDSNPMPAEYGVAPVLIKAGRVPGKLEITARTKGLKSSSGQVVTKEYHAARNVIRPIYDFDKVKVDLGGEEQLVQYGWEPWSHKDQEASGKTFNNMGGFRASIRGLGDRNAVRWLGEINVMGKYGYAHGEGVLGTAKNGLSLEFHDLKPGRYKLTTVHHAPRSNTDSMDPNQEKINTYKIYQVPFAHKISITAKDATGTRTVAKVEVTEGKDMQTKTFGTADIYLESDGHNPIQIIFRDAQGSRAVWLNSFVLTEWFSIKESTP